MRIQRTATSAANTNSGCPDMATCALFPLFSLEATMRVWQNHYCNRNHGDCVRYQMSKSGRTVPDNMLADGQRIGDSAGA